MTPRPQHSLYPNGGITLSKKNGRDKKNSTQKKNCRLEIRLTKDELYDLTKKARRAGLSKGAFVRRAVNGTEVKEAPSADVPHLISELNRVGYNLNQIAKVANAQQLVDVPLLRKTIGDVQTALKTITQAYAMEV